MPADRYATGNGFIGIIRTRHQTFKRHRSAHRRNGQNPIGLPARSRWQPAGNQQLLIFRRLMQNKKQSEQAVFLAAPLTPTAAPSSLPWERARERATSRKACIWTVRVLSKVAEIRRMPSPRPSPTGEGADCSRFCGCRRFERNLGLQLLISDL